MKNIKRNKRKIWGVKKKRKRENMGEERWTIKTRGVERGYFNEEKTREETK